MESRQCRENASRGETRVFIAQLTTASLIESCNFSR